MTPRESRETKGGETFSIARRMRSFRYAANGVAFMLRTQHNTRIHFAVTLAVLVVGWRLQISTNDWRWLVVAIVLVWVAEAMNTAFEYLCDVVSPEFHASVEKAKDIGAGAVLIGSGGAAALGVLTFLPYLSR